MVFAGRMTQLKRAIRNPIAMAVSMVVFASLSFIETSGVATSPDDVLECAPVSRSISDVTTSWTAPETGDVIEFAVRYPR